MHKYIFRKSLQTTFVIYSLSTNWQFSNTGEGQIKLVPIAIRTFTTDHSRHDYAIRAFRLQTNLLERSHEDNNTPQVIDRYSISPVLRWSQAKYLRAESIYCVQKTVNHQTNKIVDTEIKHGLPRTKRGQRFASIKKNVNFTLE